jgi:acetolactate synthase-1/2/3 large subunit
LNELKLSERPILLIGGGVSRKLAKKLNKDLQQCGIPIMTTWNGMDRYGSDLPNYWGRPNTWGQRSANILLQQSDLIIAVGTRLGLQQTGFALIEQELIIGYEQRADSMFAALLQRSQS